LWGGYKDLAKTEPWDENTIVIMNSVAKSMTFGLATSPTVLTAPDVEAQQAERAARRLCAS
jgi:hypothetical protein